MPLILAVEPDPRQASRLAAVLRSRHNTDVVMAKSAATALAAIDGRIPDVLLTSQLLSPQDEQRLADWLKDLGPIAAHVQALTIPILATPVKAEEPQRGLLSGLRRRAENPGAQGCEPKIFAEHVATYSKTPLSERQYCTKCGGHLMAQHPPLKLVDVFAATIPTLAFAPAVHVNYAETVLPMRDGLPKLKDFPKEFGGSGETAAE